MSHSRQRRSSDFVLFNVVYADGSKSSNRKVPRAKLGGFDGDDPAKEIIRTQDLRITELSGKMRHKIIYVERADDNNDTAPQTVAAPGPESHPDAKEYEGNASKFLKSLPAKGLFGN